MLPGMPPLQKPKIIGLVNDSTELMSVYTQQLARHGYSVIPMLGGTKALELLSHLESLDLLLCDFSMPEMTGIEFLQELKRVQPSLFFRTRIVGFSGYPADSPVAKQFQELGIEYQVKPDNEVDLLVLVALHLDRRRQVA